MANAKLIVLEGCDSSGKSTQLQLIKNYFQEKKYVYEYLHFPIYGHNEASKLIAAYLRGEYGNINDVNPLFVANMYAMDRFLYLPELQKKINTNDVVILDRYVFSNMAFQAAKFDNDTQSKIMIDWIANFEFKFLELPYPNLTFFLDVPLEIIETRLNENRGGEDRNYLNGKKDIHESDMEFQKRVRENYLKLKSFKNYHIIKTDDMNPQEIFEKYKNILEIIL
jgi:dTMP kinase